MDQEEVGLLGNLDTDETPSPDFHANLPEIARGIQVTLTQKPLRTIEKLLGVEKIYTGVPLYIVPFTSRGKVSPRFTQVTIPPMIASLIHDPTIDQYVAPSNPKLAREAVNKIFDYILGQCGINPVQRGTLTSSSTPQVVFKAGFRFINWPASLIYFNGQGIMHSMSASTQRDVIRQFAHPDPTWRFGVVNRIHDDPVHPQPFFQKTRILHSGEPVEWSNLFSDIFHLQYLQTLTENGSLVPLENCRCTLCIDALEPQRFGLRFVDAQAPGSANTDIPEPSWPSVAASSYPNRGASGSPHETGSSHVTITIQDTANKHNIASQPFSSITTDFSQENGFNYAQIRESSTPIEYPHLLSDLYHQHGDSILGSGSGAPTSASEKLLPVYQGLSDLVDPVEQSRAFEKRLKEMNTSISNSSLPSTPSVSFAFTENLSETSSYHSASSEEYQAPPNGTQNGKNKPDADKTRPLEEHRQHPQPVLANKLNVDTADRRQKEPCKVRLTLPAISTTGESAPSPIVEMPSAFVNGWTSTSPWLTSERLSDPPPWLGSTIVPEYATNLVATDAGDEGGSDPDGEGELVDSDDQVIE